jgi:hypothetical protein
MKQNCALLALTLALVALVLYGTYVLSAWLGLAGTLRR